MEKIEETKIRLAVLKENFEYQDFFDQFMKWIKEADKGVWPGLGFNKYGLFGLRYLIVSPAYKRDQVYDLINPRTEIESFPEKMLRSILPRLFYEPAVKLIEVKGKENYDLSELGTGIPMWVIDKKGLKSSERIYIVDLSRKKKEIMAEFEGYLDRAFSKDIEKDWKPYKKRNRKETWIHLQTWRLRRQRKDFLEIAKSLDITVDAAKKSFYRAYELTQGKKYDPDALRKEIWRVKINEIKITCDTCLKRKDCDVLCPDILRYVDQDQASLREKILSDDSDSVRDYLIQKNL